MHKYERKFFESNLLTSWRNQAYRFDTKPAYCMNVTIYLHHREFVVVKQHKVTLVWEGPFLPYSTCTVLNSDNLHLLPVRTTTNHP